MGNLGLRRFFFLEGNCVAAAQRSLRLALSSPWEDTIIESLIGKLGDDLLDREILDTLLEAKLLVERWREH